MEKKRRINVNMILFVEELITFPNVRLTRRSNAGAKRYRNEKEKK